MKIHVPGERTSVVKTIPIASKLLFVSFMRLDKRLGCEGKPFECGLIPNQAQEVPIQLKVVTPSLPILSYSA